MKTYDQLKEELQRNYPMVSPFHYWIISSPLTYPSMSIYNDESTKVFKHNTEPDVERFNNISFENCKVYQCDGKGGTDVEDKGRNSGHNLSKYVLLKGVEKKTYEVKFVFDCSRYGSIYRTITCAEDNFSDAYKHELMLARSQRNLHYDEPSIMLSKVEI